ncbi:MAG: sugar transferase [Pedobacter sp.]
MSSLQENEHAPESELWIFSDGAKCEEDKKIIDDVRAYLKTIIGFKVIKIFIEESNKGLANSIIDGVSLAFKSFDKVIVMEDDIGTTPNFLSFMNACLDKYKDKKSVYSVSGYSFDLGSCDNEDAYFVTRGWSWGWATWKDRWCSIDWQVEDYEAFKQDLTKRRSFAKGGSDLNKMLYDQMNGKIDSWAIRWFYDQYKVGGLTIYPVYSKVFNNGFDQFATHTAGSSRRYLPSLDTSNKSEFCLPEEIAINLTYQKRFQHKMSIYSRVISKLESIMQKVLLR